MERGLIVHGSECEARKQKVEDERTRKRGEKGRGREARTKVRKRGENKSK